MMPESPAISHLVVVGSSAGGIDALVAMLAGLPREFSAPIVIAQHLDPTRPSHLANILSRRSPLPVRTVTDNDPLAPSTVYVVPSNHHVTISDTHIELSEDGAARSKPSVDLLLSSASESFGERLIAVILSGTGSDGAAGARIVKKAGGTVIIQDPDTAAFPGMPLALAPNTIDIVAGVDKIGVILRDLLAGSSVPARSDDRHQLAAFLDEVRERYGLDFNTYKTATILRRLHRRIVATDTGTMEGYVEYLRDHPEEYRQLVNSFLIKVTEFFRDPDLFAYLRETIIPNLITQARKRGNELRIWSAGCATGEEAYSLAIVVSEALGAALEHFSVRIFATDADADAIAFARRGIYPATALTDLPDDLVSRYFVRVDGDYQVRKRVRGLTVFGQHDLGGRAPFPNIDLILCRNVLIYFTHDLQQRTLRLFAYSLRDGGYLALGKAETAGALDEFFTPMHTATKVYRRQGDRILLPPSRATEPLLPARRAAPAWRPSAGISDISGLTKSQQDVRQIRESAGTLLLRVPVGIVLVDRRYDIQVINGAARRFLSIHSTAIGDDLIHITRSIPPTQLREAIDAAFRGGAPVTMDVVTVDDLVGEGPRFLQITCQPQTAEGERSEPQTVIVIIEDITSQAQARQEAEQQLHATHAALDQLQREADTSAMSREQLIQRLVETNRQLIEANQDLTTTNEELRAMNEEFLMSTEEAQAAMEEVETVNEEMQATNEELETLNEELQATVEELNTTNDDLNARTVELQDLARASEQERARLETILRSLGDTVIVVNAAGSPMRTNAAYARMFADASSLLAAEDENGLPLPEQDAPLRRAARGESFTMEFTIPQPDGSRRWYEANGEPLPAGDLARGVVAIRDTTEHSLRRLQDEFLAMASHELRTPLTTVRSSLQMLQRLYTKAPADPQAAHLTDMALRQVTRLGRLVSDLLDARRLQTGKFGLRKEPFRLDEAVARAVEAVELISPEMPIRLAETDTPLTVTGDAERIEQVVLNLLINAVTHAPKGKRIDVRLRRVNDEAEIQVRDFGNGISPADLPRVFSRFYQIEHGNTGGQQGLGLGLYIAKEIVEAHGGSIGVTSVSGKGATFTVRLPLNP